MITTGSPARRAAHQRYMLARAWHSKGTIPAAIAGYREALALDPSHLESAVLLGASLQGQLRLDEALEVYRQALELHPNEARLHKEFVNVLLTQEGPDAVFRHYQLARLDSKYLHVHPGQIVCCTVLRNELPRLPYFFEYYRAKGIGAFLAVDNGSSDGTVEFLLRQPDVYLWTSDFSFNRANFGAGWFEPILRMHGQGHWCLMVDADELLYYPDCERKSIADLCGSLDRKAKRAFNAIHVDMYSDAPIAETHYTPGRPFEEACPYFDRVLFHRCDEAAGPFRNQQAFYGGVRQRVFGGPGYYLSKVPLLKYEDDCILAGGQHWTNLGPDQIAAETGALLHFKYFSSFCDRVSQEARRKEHYGDAMLYREYEQGLSLQPSLSFYDPELSVKLEDSRQLVRLGVMRVDESAGPDAVVDFPRIDAVCASTARPLWSVMLTVYRRTRYLEQALRSVLAQALCRDKMQIEVVSDGGDEATQAEIEAMVRSIAEDRVDVHRHPVRAGHPEIFNVAIRRARGRWIHILHDDDSVAPGFYDALQKGIQQAPEIGAAFCRHTHLDEQGEPLYLSLLERETAGRIDGWLDRIGVCCRLQTPSIAVRREVYERLGGYCPQANSAFDWEMWQRIAVHYPVWYEPTLLAFFRQNGESESTRLTASGQRVADTLAAIDVARSYLPAAKAETLSRRALEYYAQWAFELAEEQMKKGNLAAALANLREGIRCSRSDAVTRKLVALLSQAEQT